MIGLKSRCFAALLLSVYFAIALSKSNKKNKKNTNNKFPYIRTGFNEEEYSQSRANHSLLFAYAAYCTDESLNSWTCKWCELLPQFRDQSAVTASSLHAFTGYDSEYDQIVVSFRGTHEFNNGLTDIDIKLVSYTNTNNLGKVHEGFYKGWKALKKQVSANFKRLVNKYPTSNILVTGHSLGAAMAQIAALDLFQNIDEPAKNIRRMVHTFGSPRWGNKEMVLRFISAVDEHWRIVHMEDVVPTVPVWVGMNKFQHTPNEIWYHKDKPLKYEICDGSGEDTKCRRGKGPKPISGTSDHVNYMNVYESCKKSKPGFFKKIRMNKSKQS